MPSSTISCFNHLNWLQSTSAQKWCHSWLRTVFPLKFSGGGGKYIDLIIVAKATLCTYIKLSCTWSHLICITTLCGWYYYHILPMTKQKFEKIRWLAHSVLVTEPQLDCISSFSVLVLYNIIHGLGFLCVFLNNNPHYSACSSCAPFWPTVCLWQWVTLQNGQRM